MILTLITLGKYFEARAKGKTTDAIAKLMDLTPKEAARRTPDGGVEQVPVEQVRVGDMLEVKAGQSVPVDGIVIVTSPQDLVSMIVAKAVNMAEKMNVPILGIVENMSYIECPDCGKKIDVFGKSKLPEVAERYNLDILGKLPINPALAEACDKGEVETVLPDGMLPKAVSAVEAITPHETDEA